MDFIEIMNESWPDVKVAWDTQLWGTAPDDWPAIFSAIAAEGMSGVAFSQRVEHLPAPNLAVLKQMAEAYGLTVVSLAGGTLHERKLFCGEVKDVPLIAKSLANDKFVGAMNEGFDIHLRPHPFRELRDSRRAEELLADMPGLYYSPDSANAAISNEDLPALIQKYHQRMRLVFLEDWNRLYGSSGQRFFRGFTDLGGGDVPLAEIVRELKQVNFGGWVVLGRSVAPQGQAVECVRNAASWARKAGFSLEAIQARTESGAYAQKQEYPALEKKDDESQDAVAMPAVPLFDPSMPWLDSLHEFYQYTVNWFRRFAVGRSVGEPHVTLWSCSPHNDILSLLAADPEENVAHPVINCHDALTSMALYRQAVSVFDLSAAEPAARYGDTVRRYQGDGNSSHLVSLPLSSTACPTHVRWILNIRGNFKSMEAAECFAKDADQVCDVVAGCAHAVLDERYGIAAAKARNMAARAVSLQDCLKGLISLATETLDCACATVFLVSEDGQRLVPGHSTGLAWMGNEPYYRPTDPARTTEAWQKCRTLITYGEPRPKVEWKSYEPLPDNTVEPCSLIQPFASPVDDQVMGVMRCRGKRPALAGTKSLFTEDDIGLCEALLAPCLPYLSRWAELARQERLAAALWHELRTPVSKIRAFVEQAKSSLSRLATTQSAELDSVNVWLSRALRDIGSVRAMAEDIAVLMAPTGRIILDRASVSLVQDVLEPALARLPADAAVIYDYVGDFPLFFGDARRLEQVFANLVANAHRAANGERLFITFRGRIEGNRELVIETEDLGCGFPEGEDPNRFLLTPPDAPANLAPRKTVGLWVSGLLIHAMGGKIEVTRARQPTIISVRLPLSNIT